MDTIAWMYIAMPFIGGSYIGYRVTKWYYKRRIKDIYSAIEKDAQKASKR